MDATKPRSGQASEAVVFSTADLAPADRFESWRSVFGSVNEIAAPPAERADFLAQSEMWRLGPMVLGRTRTPARRITRSAAHCARDGIDHWVVRVTRSGAAVMRAQDGADELWPGDVQVGSLAEPYQEDRTAGEWVGLFLPRGVFSEIEARLDARGPRAVRGATASLLSSFILALVDHAPRARSDELPAMAEAARGVIAACLAGGEALRPGDRAKLDRLRVERAIRANLGAPDLDAERLCALTGLSRSTLYRLFDGSGGVAAHVRRTRLDLARLDLRDPATAALPVARIAERRGFACAASFGRAYRAAFGETPGETRAAAATERALGAAPRAIEARAGGAFTGGLAALLR